MTRSDIALRDACILADEMCYEDLIKQFEMHPNVIIPSGQRERIHKLIYGQSESERSISLSSRDKKTTSKRIKTAILIAAILIILFGITATAISPLKDFITKIYQECTEIVFDVTNKDDYPFSEYTYIPKGYVKVKDIKYQSAKAQVILYQKDKHIIKISSMKNRHSSTFIDTENTETGEILVDGISGYYSITETSIILVWSTGKYNHSLVADLNGESINLEELVKIAQSRKPAK